jgi:hypothetical protein
MIPTKWAYGNGAAVLQKVATAYISGPMTGYPEHNFPAFHKAGECLKLAFPNVKVFNPAENFGGDRTRETWEYMRLDIRYAHEAAVLVLLDGWENSRYTNLEVWIAAAENKPILKLLYREDGSIELEVIPEDRFANPKLPFQEAPCDKLPEDSILMEAERLVNGTRLHDYGKPIDDFTRTVRMWEVILDLPHNSLTPEHMALCMIAVKLSRQINHGKRDNLVDMAGYAATIEKIVKERKKREESSNDSAE